MYSALFVSTSKVLLPFVTGVVESLVQVTLVAGPPVDTQVRVNRGLAPSISTVSVIPPDTLISPVGEEMDELLAS